MKSFFWSYDGGNISKLLNLSLEKKNPIFTIETNKHIHCNKEISSILNKKPNLYVNTKVE